MEYQFKFYFGLLTYPTYKYTTEYLLYLQYN